MRRFVIITSYIIIFWILIPALIIGTSNRLDSLLNFGPPRLNSSLFAGVIILVFSVPFLGISILQYFKYSGDLPVSAYPPENIIRRGIYNYWRHPIYLFYITSFIGIAFLLRSLAMLLCVLPVFIIFTYVYICLEEKGLTKRFGDAYTYYKKQTGLIFPIIYQILRYPVLLLVKVMFHYQSKNTNLIPVSPPYFIIAEHKNYLDPFFIALSIPHPVSYLTTYEVFRTPLLRRFLQLFFCIPKKRFRPDYTSNKQMFETLDRGGVIGLFPEGERSWTGETQNFKPEVMKLLLYKNDIALLPVKIQGHYHAWPRWAKEFKRYRIRVEFRDPFYPDPNCSAEELENKIRDRIGRSSVPEKIKGKSPDFGEGLDKVFYRCSGCKGFNTFLVHENTLTCKKCGLELQISNDLTIHVIKNGSSMDLSIAEYYRSMRVTPEDPLLKGKNNNGVHDRNRQEIVVDLEESGKCKLFAETGNHFRLILTGKLLLSENSIIFKNEEEENSFRYLDISSVTTESNDKLQLYHHVTRQLYQVEFLKASVLQWQDIITSVILLKTGRSVNTR